MESNRTPLIVQSQREVLMVLDPAESLGITQEDLINRTIEGPDFEFSFRI